MINKPEKCCNVGEYTCQVPIPLNGRLQSIDYCIADIVAALNAANINTLASCCGHGKYKGSIILEDGREIIIKESPSYNGSVILSEPVDTEQGGKQ